MKNTTDCSQISVKFTNNLLERQNKKSKKNPDAKKLQKS